jgi:hypothetical protein
MFATASPHETVPVRGASRGSERNGFRRKRIVRKRMVQERAEHAEAIPSMLPATPGPANINVET